MAHKVKNNHYVATHRAGNGPRSSPSSGAYNRGYSTDGEDSHRAPSDRTLSEYMTSNERSSTPVAPSRKHRNATSPVRTTPTRAIPNNHNHNHNHSNNHSQNLALQDHNNLTDNGSDIYVTSAAYKPPSEISRHSRAPRSIYSYRSGVAPSVASTARSKTSRKAGLKVEAMAAPNPFCPNIRGMCCLMLLLNLGLILITLGFVIVIQFFEPLFVWILGIVFLIFGFLTLIGSMIYCVVVCRDAPSNVHPEDLYWTHHWSKTIGPSEIHYRAGDKPYHNDDRYSDRYSVSKLSGKYSDRESKLSRY